MINASGVATRICEQLRAAPALAAVVRGDEEIYAPQEGGERRVKKHLFPAGLPDVTRIDDTKRAIFYKGD